MRFGILWVLLCAMVYAKSFGIMILENRYIKKENPIQQQTQTIANDNIRYFQGDHTVKVYRDRSGEFARTYMQNRAHAVAAFAKKEGLDTITVISIKGALHLIQSNLYIADETLASRSSSIGFIKELMNSLPKIFVSETMKLNYELGVLHDKRYY